MTAPATAAIEIQGLSHRYRKASRPALDDVSLTVSRREIFGILGPNGGGKTTLFRILTTLLTPRSTSGHAAIFGHDVAANPRQIRRQLGVVFQHPSLDGKLTAEENLRHQGRLYGLGGTDLSRRIDHWLERFDLSQRRREPVDRFSGGMRRRLEIAKALLHEPNLLLLDEPSTGLDPGARREVWRHLTHLRDSLGLTVVLTTHLMDEAERCDRLAILSQGRLVGLDTPANLKAAIGGDVVTVVPAPPSGVESPDTDAGSEQLASLIAERLGPWEPQTAPRVVDGAVRFESRGQVDVMDELRRAWPDRIRSVTIGQPSLEDVFLHLTGQAFAAADAA